MEHSFATAPNPVLPAQRAHVFFDGNFTDTRLQHPECVAIGPDGWIWCGSENGEILRIDPQGAQIERVARCGSFTLGIAFLGDEALFACDLRDAAVYRVDLASRRSERFSAPGIRIPNYPVVDRARGRLLVSDSHHFSEPGPGVWAYDLATGEGTLWYDRSMVFANGMAFAADGAALFVCETFARRVTRIAIAADGSAGEATIFADDLPGLPDGIALDEKGAVFCACYEPSRLLRISPDGTECQVYIDDPTAHTLCHPTNIAFDGPTLYTANLGRWHITRIDSDTSALPLWRSTKR